MDEIFSPLFFRRAHERFPLTAQAQISTKVAHRLASLVADISYRGASVVTTVPLDKNEQVEVELKPNPLLSHEVRRRARVAWCSKIQADVWQAGLDFGNDKPIDFA